MLTATLLNTSLTPAFYLLSKDGLFVSVIEYIEEINSPSDFLSLLSKYDDKALEVNSLASTALKAPSQEDFLLLTLFMIQQMPFTDLFFQNLLNLV